MRFGLKKRTENFLQNLKSRAEEKRINKGVVEDVSIALQRFIHDTKLNPDALKCYVKKTDVISILHFTNTFLNNVLAKSDNITIRQSASATLDESWVVLKKGTDIVVLVS